MLHDLATGVATAAMCIGLFTAGALIGWQCRERKERQRREPGSKSVLDVEISLLNSTVSTKVAVDVAQIESIANSIGMTMTPLPSRRLQ